MPCTLCTQTSAVVALGNNLSKSKHVPIQKELHRTNNAQLTCILISGRLTTQRLRGRDRDRSQLSQLLYRATSIVRKALHTRACYLSF